MMSGLVLYSRAGCHLCDDMRDQLRPVLESASLAVQVVDVDDDDALRERFGLRVPVLALDGDVICEGRLDLDAVRDALRLD